MNQIVLEGEHLSKSFRHTGIIQTVLSDVSISLRQGEMAAIKGKSGNGKSTLLNILATLLSSDSGRVLFQGQDLQTMSQSDQARYRRQNLGYIPQNLYLLSDRNCFQNIELSLNYSCLDQKSRRERVAEIAEQIGILSLLDKSPQQLSRGERQRVAIARALVKSPQILLADEPTSSLDEETEQLVLTAMEALKIKGTCILVSTHEDSLAQRCDCQYLLHQGRLNLI